MSNNQTLGTEAKYIIVRFYYNNRPAKRSKKRISKEEAVKHCSDPTTSKPYKWFDGWTTAD